MEDAATHDDTNYALGSVLNHVVLHQTIIGQEAKIQMEKIDEYPDIVIGCCGGGSNFAGISFPFLMDKIRNGAKVRAIAVEPAACPTLTKGVFAYDYGDTARMAPIVPMYTLGHGFVPPGIHAGGLRYHGDSALVSQLYHDGLIEARAVYQKAVFKAQSNLREPRILPAPESAHAIKTAIDEAIKCRESGEAKTILFCLSGHGHLTWLPTNLTLAITLKMWSIPMKCLKEGLSCLPKLNNIKTITLPLLQPLELSRGCALIRQKELI